jgi:hypothetical protein
VEIFIPWSEDPATNQKNIEDAISAGATKLIGERGKVHVIPSRKPPAGAVLREHCSSLRSDDTGTESDDPR